MKEEINLGVFELTDNYKVEIKVELILDHNDNKLFFLTFDLKKIKKYKGEILTEEEIEKELLKTIKENKKELLKNKLKILIKYNVELEKELEKIIENMEK